VIRSLVFKNFKVLKDAKLELGPFTLLVGPNGAGKSTVFEGLSGDQRAELERGLEQRRHRRLQERARVGDPVAVVDEDRQRARRSREPAAQARALEHLSGVGDADDGAAAPVRPGRSPTRIG